jgi:hypothetical protein
VFGISFIYERCVWGTDRWFDVDNLFLFFLFSLFLDSRAKTSNFFNQPFNFVSLRIWSLFFWLLFILFEIIYKIWFFFFIFILLQFSHQSNFVSIILIAIYYYYFLNFFFNFISHCFISFNFYIRFSSRSFNCYLFILLLLLLWIIENFALWFLRVRLLWGNMVSWSRSLVLKTNLIWLQTF